MYQECRHIKTNGLRCESPALRGTPFCYFHTRLHRPVSPGQTHIWDDVKIPFLQDQTSVQIALTEILGALLSSRLDPPRARLCLYGLQIASQNVDCTTIFPVDSVRSVTQSADGEDLAPERFVCKRPQDYPTCKQRETCEAYDPNDEEDDD